MKLSKIIGHFKLESATTNLVVLLVMFVALGAYLRLNALDSKGILFSDAGRDLLVAHAALQNGELPLLGIPSSVPRFKQGPLSIWYSMAIIKIFGANTHALSMGYALLSIAALIITYEFLTVTIYQKTGLLTTMILAASPLAIAGARVPYHTTPIPLFAILYLIALYALWKKKPYSLLFAGLTFALLFQFELALAALLVAIPYVLWRSKQLSILKTKKVGWLVLGIGLGLLPQIIFDLTHNFAQLGVFGLWVGHKVWEFVTFAGSAQSNPWYLINNIFTYLSRVYSLSMWVGVPALFMNLVAIIWLLWQQKRQTTLKQRLFKLLPIPGELALVASLILISSFIIHGAPSEAYFPVFTILLPILTTTVIFQLPNLWRDISVGFLSLLLIFNVICIFQHNFFVSNHLDWSYGPSIGEQKQVLAFIVNRQDLDGYQLRSTAGYEQQFPDAFANYDWVGLELGAPPQSETGEKYFLANPWDKVNDNLIKKTFQSVTVSWEIGIK